MNGQQSAVPDGQLGRSSALRFADARIRLFGGFQIDLRHATIGESGWRLRKARSLVKLLALSPQRRLLREEVLECLWPELDRDAAGNNLRTTLHTARRMLEQGGSSAGPAITTAGGMLVLFPDQSVWIDVIAFDEATTFARRTGEPDDYRAALSLYDGELLPEDRYEEWTIGQRNRLRSRWLMLLRELAAIYHERDATREAISLWQQILAAESADEAAHVALMRLYARTGQRLQALRQYQHLRQELQDELDVEPSQESSLLYERILAGDIAESAPAVPPTTTEGHRPTERRQVQLPDDLTSFVGRRQEIADVVSHLRTSRLVTLTGPGGSGKTRLAIEVSRTHDDELAGRIWFVELAPIVDPSLVEATVAATLGVGSSARQTLLEAITQRLSSQPALLVLDNCEHLVESCAELSHALLLAVPQLRILATSREHLGVAGETIWQVPPLQLDGAAQDDPDVDPSRIESVQLFVERARLANPRFELSDLNLRTALAVCRSLDGMPLAIELAAARTRVLPIEQLIPHLDDALTLLSGGARTTPTRQQSMRNAIDWSYQLLSADEQRLFRRLAVFAGSFTAEAAIAICDGDGLSRSAILELLFQLADKSLIVPQADAGSARLRMMEPLRQYATELLDSGEHGRLREAHADYYTQQANDAAPHLLGAEIAKWMDRLEIDHDNLRLAIGWAIESGNSERGLAMGKALWRFWWHHGHLREGSNWLKRVLAIPGAEVDSELRAWVLFGAGLLAKIQQDGELAVSYFRDCVSTSQRIGLQVLIASGQTQLGAIALNHCDDVAAESLMLAGLEIRRALGRTREIAVSLGMLGSVALARRNFDAAEQYITESITLLEDVGDLTESTMRIGLLSHVVARQGDFVRARALVEQAIARATAVPYRLPILLLRHARIELEEGNLPEAHRLAVESLQMSIDPPMHYFIAVATQFFAAIAAGSNDPERAVRLEAAATALLKQTDVMPGAFHRHWQIDGIAEAGQQLSVIERSNAAAIGTAMTIEDILADVLPDPRVTPAN